MQEQFRRRHLPHWDLPGGTYFVTACLAGSIPAQGLLDIRSFERQLDAQPRPPQFTAQDWAVRQRKRLFARRESWLDRKPAVRHLADPALAAQVQQALYYFAEERYELLAYVVMPSHIHWVFRPRHDWVRKLPVDSRRSPRERIMHSLKRYSAEACNRLLGRTGPFWQDESYDHVVRDEEELLRIVEYIEDNPVKAGLTERRAAWRYSSAYDREARGDLRILSPLLRLP
jgi:putative transposase